MKMSLRLAAVVLMGVGNCFGEGALGVHEWGTFTILSGSDGQPMAWYQPVQSIVELPSFVGQPSPWLMLMKGGTQLDYVRMETPVLYFYPEGPMSVDVKVSFAGGRITENYPVNDSYKARSGTPGAFAPGTTAQGNMSVITWKGNLLPPDDATASSKMPTLTGQKGAHYGHAREVPAAWFFHNTPIPAPSLDPAAPTSSPVPMIEQWEKFIFYRGAGESLPPLSANVGADNRTVTLSRADEDVQPTVAFVLNVDGRRARWARMPLLNGRKADGALGEVQVQLGAKSQPLETVTAELAQALTAAIIEAGLTQDEAKAMVATWREVWFEEPGTRVLAILPRPWVDAVLPLEIKPTPTQIKRVFVGRFELITAEREAALLALLEKPDTKDAKQLTAFRALQLGRFGAGVLQRVQAIQAQKLAARFNMLETAATPPQVANRVDQ